jgi:hypothetical protein
MYTDVMGNPPGKCPCGTLGRRWEDNINVRPREIGEKSSGSFQVAGFGISVVLGPLHEVYG